MKKDRVGTIPFNFSHSGDDRGKQRSREHKYAVNSALGSHGYGFGPRMMMLPSKNLSALWPGKKNWKKVLLMMTEFRFVSFCGSLRSLSSGQVSSPKHTRAKKSVHSCAQKRRSLCDGFWEYLVHTAFRSSIVSACFCCVGVPLRRLQPCKVPCTSHDFQASLTCGKYGSSCWQIPERYVSMESGLMWCDM